MSEDSASLDLVELTRGSLEAVNRRDLDTVHIDIAEGCADAQGLLRSRG
jgi:hypothetical protein